MDRNNRVTDIKGVITPIVTPLKDYDKLDYGALERLVDHLIGEGVHGIFALGTTGEFAGLSRRLRHELLEKVCKLADQRIPVLAGITDTSMEESLSLAETAHKYGAHGLVLAPPYYYPMDQSEMLAYFERVAISMPLPLYLYNIPSTTHVEIRIETVARAAGIPGIAGIKDSSGNQEYFTELIKALQEHPGFSVYMGADELMADALLSGAEGCISGGANAFPSLFVNLYNAVSSKDHTRISEWKKKILEVNDFIDGFGQDVASYIRVLKGFLSCMGICSDVMAPPFQLLSDKEKNQIEMYLQNMSK
jgi:4-hydroxy-tetrahydrodipicolinate synthase